MTTVCFDTWQAQIERICADLNNLRLFLDSTIQRFNSSTIPQFHNSTIQRFNDSTVIRYDNRKIIWVISILKFLFEESVEHKQ